MSTFISILRFFGTVYYIYLLRVRLKISYRPDKYSSARILLQIINSSTGEHECIIIGILNFVFSKIEFRPYFQVRNQQIQQIPRIHGSSTNLDICTKDIFVRFVKLKKTLSYSYSKELYISYL